MDFFCANCGVIVEVDGSSHNDKAEYDAQRDAFLEGLGLTVIHIAAQDILSDLNSVMSLLHDHPAPKSTSLTLGTPSTGGEFDSGHPLHRRGI